MYKSIFEKVYEGFPKGGKLFSPLGSEDSWITVYAVVEKKDVAKGKKGILNSKLGGDYASISREQIKTVYTKEGLSGRVLVKFDIQANNLSVVKGERDIYSVFSHPLNIKNFKVVENL